MVIEKFGNFVVNEYGYKPFETMITIKTWLDSGTEAFASLKALFPNVRQVIVEDASNLKSLSGSDLEPFKTSLVVLKNCNIEDQELYGVKDSVEGNLQLIDSDNVFHVKEIV